MSELGLLLSGVLFVGGLTATARGLRPVGRPRTFELSFPRGATVDQTSAAMRSIAGLLPPLWRRMLWRSPTVAFEVRADHARIAHYLIVGEAQATYTLAQLSAAVPGLRVIEREGLVRPPIHLAREMRLKGDGGLRTDAAPATTASVLAALQPLRRDEHVVVQYVVSPIGRPVLERVGAWLGPREPTPLRPSVRSLSSPVRRLVFEISERR